MYVKRPGGQEQYSEPLKFQVESSSRFADLTGRFLDPPEFTVFHDKGNEENIYDRIDYNFTPVDSVHLDLNYSRSWFQTPNAFSGVNVQNVVGATGASPSPVFATVGNTDQRSFIGTYYIHPTYTRVVKNYSVFNLSALARAVEDEVTSEGSMLWTRRAKRRNLKPAPGSGPRNLVLTLKSIGDALQTNGGSRNTAAGGKG